MRILVITSCTGEKASKHPHELTLEDFADPTRLAQREQELADLMRPAGQMYEGEQHCAVMRRIRTLRAALGDEAVTLKIVSAGYGLVDEDQPVAPYNVTLSKMRPRDARAWAHARDIPAAVRSALPGHDLAVVLLGSRYLSAIEPPLRPESRQRLIYFAKPAGGHAGRRARRGRRTSRP